MKVQVQEAGVREWYGDDFIKFQDELYTALEGLAGDFGNCIVSGCKITGSGPSSYNVSAGVVYLLDDTGANGRLCYYGGDVSISLPIYLEQGMLDSSTFGAYGRAYKDAVVRDIINDYYAKALTSAPAHSEYITISAIDDNNTRLKDQMAAFLQANYVSTSSKIGLIRHCTNTEAKQMASSNDKAIVASNLGVVLAEQVTKEVNIGVWDMDTNPTATVAHGLSATEWKTIKGAEAFVINDADTARVPLSSYGYIVLVDSTNISLARNIGGLLDDAAFSDGVINRGYLTFRYIAD